MCEIQNCSVRERHELGRRGRGLSLEELHISIRRLCVKLFRQSVELVLFNVVYDGVWQEILNTLTAADKETNFTGGDIVKDGLFDDFEIFSVSPKKVMGKKERPHIRTCPFDDHAAILAQNMIQLDQKDVRCE